MLGLIKKDLFVVKSNLKIAVIIFAVYLLMSFNGNEGFMFMPIFISVVIMMSTFSYDEYNKTDAFITTCPNGKKNAVKAKYIATFIILLMCLAFSVLGYIVIGIFQNSLIIDEIISNIVGSTVGILLFQSILYPFIFKFGIEKSRILSFIFAFGVFALSMLLIKSGIKLSISEELVSLLNHYWMILFPLISIIILFISYKTSEILYSKKEF